MVRHPAKLSNILDQTDHLCELGKMAALQLSPVALQHCFFSHSDVTPFIKPLWNLFDRKLLINSNKLSEILNDLDLNIKPGNEIFPNTLEISKNTAHISFGGSQSRFIKISWFIDRSCFTPESNGNQILTD